MTDLIRMLRRIPGVEELSLTTNGETLHDLAGPLRESGLDRVTVSLDSLRPDRFRRITRQATSATSCSASTGRPTSASPARR